MRQISLNARHAIEDHRSDEVEVALFVIEHPELDQVLRLSTDPTERLSIEPLAYGTRSTWQGAGQDEPYFYIVASAGFPSDLEDAPASSTLILDNVDPRIATALRQTYRRATIHMAVVLASSTDTVEVEFLDMRLVGAEGDAAQITLSISREPIEEESAPKDRFTKARFPGLYS